MSRGLGDVYKRQTLNSGFDYQTLVEDMDNLDMDWEALGFAEFIPKFDDDEEEPQDEEDERVKLSDRFGVAPFSVLDARKGDWADRKHQWMSLGIRSELGRGAAPVGGTHAA